MRKSRFTEAQIIGMIKGQEARMPTAEVCRRPRLSSAWCSFRLPMICSSLLSPCLESRLTSNREIFQGSHQLFCGIGIRIWKALQTISFGTRVCSARKHGFALQKRARQSHVHALNGRLNLT